ncbi:DUF6378 domain-containing protein [Gallibacterium anatis]|uniref:DUF6378 domain-containing protein n=1 Tax=Gallibacterium anatis TaxID=750 RepID=UPI003004CF61
MTTEIENILTQRRQTHGRFIDNAITAQTLKATVRNSPNWSTGALTLTQREAIDMILHKIARLVNGDPHHEDTMIDIVGYAQLMLDEHRDDFS